MTYQFSLGVSDAHLREIGRVAAEWSFLEGAIETIIWAMIGVKPALGAPLTVHMPTKTRIDCLRALANAKPWPEQDKREIDKLLDNTIAHTLFARRNAVIHAFWEDGPAKPDAATALEYRARGKIRYQETNYRVDQINQIAADIAEATKRLYSLFAKLGVSHAP